MSLWNIDDYGVFFSFGPIILVQLLTKAAHVYPDGRIQPRIVVRRPSQAFDTDRVFLELVCRPFNGFLRKIAEKPAQSFRVSENSTLDHSVDYGELCDVFLGNHCSVQVYKNFRQVPCQIPAHPGCPGGGQHTQ